MFPLPLTVFHDQHTRQLPLIAARHVLDALAQPNTAEGLKQAAEHARRAAENVAELCGRFGRTDLRSSFANDVKAAKLVRDTVDATSCAVGPILTPILARAAAVIRGCEPNSLPDEAVQVAERARPKAVRAILEAPVGLPPRAAEGAVAAYVKDLRYLAAELAKRQGQRYKRDDDAWVLTRFKRGEDGLHRPYGVFGEWRGHLVGATDYQLNNAGIEGVRARLLKAAAYNSSRLQPRELQRDSGYGDSVLPFVKYAAYERLQAPNTGEQMVYVPEVVAFLERLAAFVETGFEERRP